MKVNMGAVLFGLLAAVFVLVGLFLLWGATHNLVKMRQTASWPTTTGVVTSTELTRVTGSRRPSYRVDVTYVYTVGGQSYTGNVVTIGYAGDGEREVAEALLRKLQSARSVAVHYNPKAPADAVLITVIRPGDWTLLAFALTWLLALTGMITIAALMSGSDDASWLEGLVVMEAKEAR